MQLYNRLNPSLRPLACILQHLSLSLLRQLLPIPCNVFHFCAACMSSLRSPHLRARRLRLRTTASRFNIDLAMKANTSCRIWLSCSSPAPRGPCPMSWFSVLSITELSAPAFCMSSSVPTFNPLMVLIFLTIALASNSLRLVEATVQHEVHFVLYRACLTEDAHSLLDPVMWSAW